VSRELRVASCESSRIGITTTIPVEIVYAAGHVPVDLNNIFIGSDDPQELVRRAEYEGYPRNICGWIKGIYSTVIENGIKTIIAAVEGDCSQTQAMMETLTMRGIEVIPFAFPYGRDRDMLSLQLRKLAERLGAEWSSVVEWKLRLDAIRELIQEVDDLTWRDGKVTGFENHSWQISASDFWGDPDRFEREIDVFLTEARAREPRTKGVRIGYAGIPPIFTDFYQFLEEKRAQVVFNEVQRQFAMPYDSGDIVEQYALYTYPYDVFGRIEDISREIEQRNIKGLIHYTQSFCFRQIQDLIIRKHIHIPILTLEGESPGPLDARTRVRIESFLEMLGE
jgi:benzoyl-CoA reductase/2-hydroxyglutaryl-CoA dehydratase subunit BcrC/BadD/HgdB